MQTINRRFIGNFEEILVQFVFEGMRPAIDQTTVIWRVALRSFLKHYLVQKSTLHLGDCYQLGLVLLHIKLAH